MSLWIPLSANYIYTVTSCSYPAGIGLFTYICTYTHTHICIYTVMGVWPLYKGILYKFRYIYIYIYIHIYIYYIDVYSSMYVYKCTQDTCGLSHMSVCRHVGILIYIYTCIHVQVHIYAYVYVCTMHVCAHMYIYVYRYVCVYIHE